MINGTVAIVGRPNVGKSTIFNRFYGERVSIVEDTPGVTRDRIYGKIEWLTRKFNLIDTGGIQLDDARFQQEINMQVDIAIEEADTIIFIVDGLVGLQEDDYFIARKLQESGKHIILAVNKIDDLEHLNNIYEFYNLGLGDPIALSGEHGVGVGDVLDEVVKSLENIEEEVLDDAIRFAIIGRPNVGKSTLVNKLLREERVIVSNVEGTTRDAIDTRFTDQETDEEFVVVDTAGIRKRGKVYESIEKYSVLRAMSAIDKADVIVFVIDGEKGIVEQDKTVAGYAVNAGKPIIIAYNKWDTVDKSETDIIEKTEEIRNQFVYLKYAPVIFISSLTGQRVNRIIPLVKELYENSTRRISTSVLNEVILDAQVMSPPPIHNGRRLRIYYATQVSTVPPTIVLFVNDENLVHFSYKRYLENRLREAFIFDGTPIRIITRKRSD
ncbi:MAG: ribosome biogenesis GTPase Der [Erysipelothrix sp.]|nr:ribosome biogenesis GTPase Der [Erysipelothrix sp.]